MNVQEFLLRFQFGDANAWTFVQYFILSLHYCVDWAVFRIFEYVHIFMSPKDYVIVIDEFIDEEMLV